MQPVFVVVVVTAAPVYGLYLHRCRGYLGLDVLVRARITTVPATATTGEEVITIPALSHLTCGCVPTDVTFV